MKANPVTEWQTEDRKPHSESSSYLFFLSILRNNLYELLHVYEQGIKDYHVFFSRFKGNSFLQKLKVTPV